MKARALLSLALMLQAGAAFAGSITEPSVERSAPNKVTVRWTDADPVDVFVSDRPDATVDTARRVSRNDRDGHHDLKGSAAQRSYFLLRDRASGQVVRVAERVLPLEQGSNFRDIGGYAAADGKHVRWGLIYRSGGTPLLSEADLRQVQALGLAKMVDLRSDEERVLAPTRIDGVPYTAVGYSMGPMVANLGKNKSDPMKGIEQIYRNFPTQLAPQLRLVFRSLLAKEGPLAYNCSAGQDRTGFTTAMILSALGVPRETIYADYALSTTYRRPAYEMTKIDPAAHADEPVALFFAKFQGNPDQAKPKPLLTAANKPYLAFSFDEIERRWGSVEGYLEKELGVGTADLATLRATYLE